MNTLEIIQARIKYSRLYIGKNKGVKRLYIPYGKNCRGVKTSTWFEVVNDHLQVFCRVENDRHPDYYDTELASCYKQEIEKQFNEIINNCELERKKIPLHERLKDDIIPVYDNSLIHQAQALRFCCSMKVSALFADTGTGKTKIAIDLINSRYEAGEINKALVFCPVSTKKNFRDEIEKWSNTKNVCFKIVGIESLSSSDITYLDILNWVDSETQIVIDESHLCKTPTAIRSKRILNCCRKTSYKLIMTGTPTENVRDLYMQYAMLSHLITECSNWIKFEDKFLIINRERDEVIGYKNMDYLMGLLEPYTYQVKKEDVLNLPAKNTTQLYCDLNDKQSDRYYELKEELLQKLANFDDYVPATLIFQYFTYMQQVCCGFYKDRSGILVDIGNYKTELIEQTGYKEGQTLFFCKYLYEVNWVVDYLGRENCSIFTGKNPKERDSEKELFTTHQKKYFVATMSSGGTGLNGLQECQRIIFISNSFKWRERKQCIGRIDRQGQTKEMEIWDTLTNAGMDSKIKRNLAAKGNLAEEIRALLSDKTKLKQYIETL